MGLLRRLLHGMERPTKADLDAATILALERAGADLGQPRETDHFLHFRTEAAARTAASQVSRPFRTVSVEPSAAKKWAWLIHVAQTMVVGSEQIAAARAEFEAVAAAGGGEYDGWGATVHEVAPTEPPQAADQSGALRPDQ